MSAGWSRHCTRKTAFWSHDFKSLILNDKLAVGDSFMDHVEPKTAMGRRPDVLNGYRTQDDRATPVARDRS